MPEQVVIIGGGVGGLRARPLGPRSQAGHEVTPARSATRFPPTADAEEAFLAERRGAPQVHQTHGFLARLQVTAARALPRRAWTPCLAAGGSTDADGPQPRRGPGRGDEDLQVIIVRRTTLEVGARRGLDAAHVRDPHRPGRRGRRGRVARRRRHSRSSPASASPTAPRSMPTSSSPAGRRGDVPAWLGDVRRRACPRPCTRAG